MGVALTTLCSEVIYRVRASCLNQVRLLSDWPTRIRIDRRTSRPPAIWLHSDASSMAWLLLDIVEVFTLITSQTIPTRFKTP